LSSQAIAEAVEVIGGRFGPQYVVPKGRTFKTKTRNAQEAHEAIRPTSFGRDPDAVAKHLGNDEARLYRLIWQRAIASQMAAKEQETTSVDLAANGYELRANATRTTFDGFSRVYTEGHDDIEEEAECALPPLVKGNATDVDSVKPLQHFTEPPPRYTEATLIKALEEHGIGRPSTYAATISTIVDRGYVKVSERRLYPEPVGEVVTDLLVTHFGEFVDLEFTARMEDDLDEVASGKRSRVPVVSEIYTPFRARIDEKTKELKRADFTTRPSDELCSEGHAMVIRLGRYGEFLACSNYPEHKETRELPGVGGSAAATAVGPDGATGEPAAPEVCPKCGEAEGGVLVQRRGRFGPFIGCARYPDCDYIKKEGPPPPPPLPFEVACPTCAKGHLVARRARRTGSVFWGCSKYPTCRYTTSHEPIGALHDADGGPVGRNAEAGLCLTCGATVDLTGIDEFVGKRLAGGEPNPDALSKPSAGRGGRRTGSGAAASRTGARKPAAPRKTAARRAG
jgi:DNA topoisomerase-1